MEAGLSQTAMDGICVRHRIDARSLPKDCYHPGCSVRAIASHFVQRKGPLRHIVENDWVVELRDYLGGGEWTYRFERVSPAKTMTFRGFCAAHDGQLFRPIETPSPDWSSKRSLVLVSYRAFLNEVRKVEKNVDWMRLCLEDKRLANSGRRERWQAFLEVNRSQLLGMLKLKRRIEVELDRESGFFDFEASDLIDGWHVASSAMFGREVLAMRDGNLEPQTLGYTTRFLHLIPASTGKTRAIFGCMVGDAPAMHAELREARLQRGIEQMVTEILVQRCETWCCKPSWYATHVAPREEQVLGAIRDHLPPDKKGLPLPFNLFQAPT